MKNKYTVSYKKVKYKVTLIDKLVIEKIKSILLIKRILRNSKRIFIDHNKHFFYLLLLWVVFGFFTYLFGVKFRDPSYSILDVAWELKNSFFSSFIITWFINIYNNEYNYRKKLWEQHEFYVDTMSCFEKIFEPFVGEHIYYYHAFYNSICYENTIDYIHNIEIDRQCKRELIGKIKNILAQLKTINYEIKNNNIYKADTHYLIYKIPDIIIDLNELLNYLKLKKIIVDDVFTKISKITMDLFKITEELRIPWRQDIENNIIILQRLSPNTENEIERAHYYNLLLNGYSFNFNIQKD